MLSVEEYEAVFKRQFVNETANIIRLRPNAGHDNVHPRPVEGTRPRTVIYVVSFRGNGIDLRPPCGQFAVEGLNRTALARQNRLPVAELRVHFSGFTVREGNIAVPDTEIKAHPAFSQSIIT
ncbi:MAG: hypothetical protein ABSB35_28015 [Bryobacteraceae bacterium]